MSAGNQTASWDVATGKFLRRLPTRAISLEVRALGRFPAGAVAITSDGRGAVGFWTLASGKPLRSLRLPPRLAPGFVRLALAGKPLVVREVERKEVAINDLTHRFTYIMFVELPAMAGQSGPG